MKFNIGNLEVETSEALGTNDFTPYALDHQAALGRTPRAVYYWDCHLGNRNPLRPKNLYVEPHLSTLVLKPDGKADDAASNAAAQRLLQASGAADLDALNDALLAEFPTVAFPIPWAQIVDALNHSFSIRYYAWVTFFDLFLKPTGGPAARDRYILSYPVEAQFVATAVDYCPIKFLINPPQDKTGTSRVKPGGGKPKEFGDEFTDDLNRRLREERDRMSRLGRRIRSRSDQRKKDYRDKLREELDRVYDDLDED